VFFYITTGASDLTHTSSENPFDAHGIEHLSPSTCNLFIGSPAMFVLDKILKRRQPVGAAAHRGTAVEEGIVLGLTTGINDNECISAARQTYSRLSAFTGDPKRDKEGEAIADFVKIGLAELRSYGKPTSTQGKVVYQIDGLSVPMLGFYDIAWEDKGILIDIKTSHALPNKIKVNHARQVALYAAVLGNNIDARLTYVTPKKVATYRLENIDEHLAALRKIALTIQSFLSLSKDPIELASLVVPDTDSFYFNDPLTRQAAFEVWGI
jgi:hypothetical protein